MKFFCDTCGQRLEVLDEYAGHLTDCPSCQNEILIPEAPPAISEEEIEQAMKDSLSGPDSVGSMTIAQLMVNRQIEGGLQISRDVLEGDQNLKYNYGELIAKGGMGAVFSASDQNIRRNVAMKVLLDPDSASNDDILRFIEEAQVTGQLEHPSVVPVHDLGVDGAGNVFYTMKMVKGDNLHAVLSRIAAKDRKTIAEYSLSRLLNIFLKVCDAMAFAHSKNVIHRDLKPENIMVGEFGEVLVMDWGLAKVLGQSREDPHATADQINSVRQQDASGALATLAGTIFGTPQFMAPEQAKGATNEMDQRTDIYSLGAILYNILALRPPVEGKTIDEILTRVTSGNIVTPTVYNTVKADQKTRGRRQAPQKIVLSHCPNEKIPPALGAIVMKSMALDRADRYQEVAQLKVDIEAYQGGFATSAEEAGAMKLIALFIQRNKLATVSALVISLLGLGFVGKTVSAAREIQTVSRKAAPEFVDKAREGIKQNRDGEAKEAIDTALGLNRKSPEAWFELARMQFDTYEFDDVISTLDKVDDLGQTNPELLERSGAFRSLTEKWNTQIKIDGKGVLPKHLFEMAPETQHVDPTLAARLFARVGDEQKAQKLKIAEVFKQLIAANPGLKFRNDEKSQEWPMGISYFYWHHFFKESGVELNLNSFLVDPKKLVNAAPLADFPFRVLKLQGTGVSDLTPLGKIATLKDLTISETAILSLKGLEGSNIESLKLHSTRVDDLTPIAGLPLTGIDIGNTRITDLSPLSKMRLEGFHYENMKMEDIEALRGLPLKRVTLSGATNLKSIEPLRGAPIEDLNLFYNRSLTDTSILADMPLTNLQLGTTLATDTSILHGKNLDFLKIEMDLKDLLFLRHCKVRSLGIRSNTPTSLAGIESQADTMDEFSFWGSKYAKLNDISALKTLKKVKVFRLHNVPVTDVSAIRGFPLEKAEVILPEVQDISAFRAMNKLAELHLGGSKITDISPLAGLEKLHSVYLNECSGLRDFLPLQSLPNLFQVALPGTGGDIEFLRGKPKLQRIGIAVHPRPVAQFWKEYDAQ